MELCYLFLANFVNVFLLGLQQQVVTNQRVALAFTVSWGISSASFIYTRMTALSTDPVTAYFVVGFGGSIGVVFSMYAWRWYHKRRALSLKSRGETSGVVIGFRPIRRIV